MRISDWSSDVCSSDLRRSGDVPGGDRRSLEADQLQLPDFPGRSAGDPALAHRGGGDRRRGAAAPLLDHRLPAALADDLLPHRRQRSEEHTSELQSLMRISYAVFCLKKKNTTHHMNTTHIIATHLTQVI